MSINQRLCPAHGLGRHPGCFGCNVVVLGERDRTAEFRESVEREAIKRAAIDARVRELGDKSSAELERMAEGLS